MQVQRGLKIWSSGHDAKAGADAEKKVNPKAKVPTFTFSEQEWGGETREWVKLTSTIKDTKDWAAIRRVAAAASKTKALSDSNVRSNQEDVSASNAARASVVLSFR